MSLMSQQALENLMFGFFGLCVGAFLMAWINKQAGVPARPARPVEPVEVFPDDDFDDEEEDDEDDLELRR